jgi:hypothetical protein
LILPFTGEEYYYQLPTNATPLWGQDQTSRMFELRH